MEAQRRMELVKALTEVFESGDEVFPDVGATGEPGMGFRWVNGEVQLRQRPRGVPGQFPMEWLPQGKAVTSHEAAEFVADGAGFALRGCLKGGLLGWMDSSRATQRG